MYLYCLVHMDHSPQLWTTVHKYGSQSINMDHNPQIWITVQKYGSQSTNVDHRSQLWITVHKYGSQSTNVDHSVMCQKDYVRSYARVLARILKYDVQNAIFIIFL